MNHSLSMIFRLAARNLIRNKRRSLISLSALFFGVYFTVVLKGLTDGFSTMTTLSAVETRTAALQIRKKGSFDNLSANPAVFSFTPSSEMISKIRALPEVRGVAGRLQFLGQITNGKKQTLILGTGQDPLLEPLVCNRSGQHLLAGGVPLGPNKSDGILVGQSLAEGLETKNGQTLILSVVNPKGAHNSLDFPVQAIFSGLNPLEEKRQVTLSLTSAQSLLALDGQVTELAVGLHKIADLKKVKVQLEKIVDPDLQVLTWEQLQPFVRDILFRQQVGISILAAALLIMVVFLITNTMLMAVFERTKEMGTMISLGITRSQIMGLFLTESLLLGVVAATFAVVLGGTTVALLGIRGFEFGTLAFEAQMLKPEVSVSFLAVAWFGAVVCAALAGTYPANKASRLNPVEALRSS